MAINCEFLLLFSSLSAKNAREIHDRFTDFVLDVEFLERDRDLASPVDGNQTVMDLRDYPLIRATGVTSVTVCVCLCVCVCSVHIYT